MNGSGAIANRYEYTPWGAPISTLEQVAQPLRYMAREYDAVTGLYYVRARWYDSNARRFTSEAPIGSAGGINPYAYANNDPVNRTDPFGPEATCLKARGDSYVHFANASIEANFVVHEVVWECGGAPSSDWWSGERAGAFSEPKPNPGSAWTGPGDRGYLAGEESLSDHGSDRKHALDRCLGRGIEAIEELQDDTGYRRCSDAIEVSSAVLLVPGGMLFAESAALKGNAAGTAALNSKRLEQVGDIFTVVGALTAASRSQNCSVFLQSVL